MADSPEPGADDSHWVEARAIAREAAIITSPNGVRYAAFGETGVQAADLLRVVRAVPKVISAALKGKAYYFVPLVLADSGPAGPSGPAESKARRRGPEETMVSGTYSAEMADLAICHRNVTFGAGSAKAADDGFTPAEGVFISARLLTDRFSLAFEFFINVAHAFVDAVGVPAKFSALAWKQAVADIRGETSQDAWESRSLALKGTPGQADAAAVRTGDPGRAVDEEARTNFLESAFADGVAIYLLSLAVDFDYSELREREYPLLAPQALAERLRMMAELFPANEGYEFAIKYRRRA